MAWLVRDGEVLASLEVADSATAKGRGLLGRDGCNGAMLLAGCRSVHSLGMRFAIDVAFLDENLRVVKIVQLPRNRLAWPVRGARSVLEAEAGSFREWGLLRGDELEVR